MKGLSKNGSFILLLCLSLLLGVTLGCKRISEFANKGAIEVPSPSSSPSLRGNETEGGTNSLIKKSNLYITECFNKYSNSVVSSHNRYASWLKDLEAGPTGRESIVYGLYDISGDGSDCEKAIASAKAMEPSIPELEEVADRYVVSLKEVVKNINGIAGYYEQEDYKDDNFAKGKEAHSALLAAFKDFKSVNTEFAAEVDRLEDEVAEKELESLKEKSGTEYDQAVVESGIKAKKVKSLLQSKEFEEISADELTPLIEDFEKSIESLKTAGSKRTNSDMYVRSSEEFLKAAKEMMRRIRDGKKFSNIEKQQIAMGAGWMVEGSPAKVIKAYNDLIRQRSFSRF